LNKCPGEHFSLCKRCVSQEITLRSPSDSRSKFAASIILLSSIKLAQKDWVSMSSQSPCHRA